MIQIMCMVDEVTRYVTWSEHYYTSERGFVMLQDRKFGRIFKTFPRMYYWMKKQAKKIY